MANPSLQIGNGKFAIKENDLLGYSSLGTKFFPIPITMTRATLGTRVNPSGLVEDVELLGSELVSCGNFECANPNAAWTITNNTGTNTRIENNHLIIETDGTYTQVIQSNALEIGKNYKLVYDVTATDGGALGLETGGATSLIPNNIGTHTFYWSSNSTTFTLKRYSGALNITIDNVSVKEATIDGLARVDYTDGTGSLLVEPQRTNLITYSEDFSESYWTETGATVESGFTSPDGTENAYKLKEDLNTSAHSLYRSNFSINTVRTFSVFAKASEKERISIYDANKFGKFIGVIFNLTSGIVESNQDDSVYLNPKIELISNGWYRCSVTWQNASLQVPAFAPAILSTNVYEGDGVSGIYVYGAQLEAASYPTSYIKTQGSTVTRNQDEYSKTGISDKINSEEGVLFLEMAALSDDLTFRSISLNDGTNTNSVGIRYRTNSNRINAIIKDDNGVTFQMNFDVSDITQFNKIALKYKSGDNRLYINGTEVSTNSSTFSFTSALNDASFNRGDGNDDFYGKVRQLQVYKTALSDSELATLTTI